MALHEKSFYHGKPMIAAPYRIGADGLVTPEAPKVCPLSVSGDDCHIVADKVRHRICGPGFDLRAYCCKRHRSYFTLYPPGWTPYARKPLVPVDCRGNDLELPVGAQDSGPETIITENGDQGIMISQLFESTEFQACVHAASGRLWPAETLLGPSVDSSEPLPPGCLATQRRQVRGAIVFFGLHEGASAENREQVARLLRIPMGFLLDCARRIRAGPGLIGASKVVLSLLAFMVPAGPVSRTRHTTKIGTIWKFWGHPVGT